MASEQRALMFTPVNPGTKEIGPSSVRGRFTRPSRLPPLKVGDTRGRQKKYEAETS